MQHHSGKFFVICIVAFAAAFVNMPKKSSMTVMLLVAKSMWEMASKARIYMGTAAASICFAYSLILSVTSQVSA